MEKTILILANSIRRSNRCIAGREATNLNNKWQIGQWVRPVSAHGEGEVSPLESRCSDGSQPAVLDIIKVPLLSKQECLHQPENYTIDTAVRWVKLARVGPDLSGLIENPPSLWLQPYARSDRVHSSHLDTGPGYQSLYLIRPVGLHYRIWEEINPFRGHRHKQRRALFTYAGIQYDLPITDPTMDRRYFTPFPALNQPPRDIAPSNPDRCLLVVSLGAPFTDGNHYKLVATVIDY